MLKGNGSSTKFENIEPTINAVTSDMESMAEVVAKHKGEIFDILKNNLAEEKDDEKLLKKLRDTLVDKKNEFINEFGHSDPKLINFQNDKDIVDLRTMKINDTIPGTPASDTEKADLKALVRKTLVDMDSLNKYDKTKKTLFMAITKPIDDIDNNIKTQIGTLLKSTDAVNIGKDLDSFIKKVYKRGSAFSVAGGKLYDKAPEAKDDLQRKSSIRIAVYLYLLDNLIDNDQLTSEAFIKAKDIIEEQIQKEESNKITGIYNVKKELEYVEPEHDTLRDINTKDTGDIDIGTEKYEISTKKIDKELTSEYEHGLATDLDKFVLETKKITTDKGLTVKMIDISGPKNKIEAARGKLEDIDLQVEIGGKDIMIGKLALNNKDRIGNAKFIFEMVTWPAIKSKLSNAEIAANFPLEIKFGVQGIKKVKNPPVNGNVGLTRNLVINLEPGDGGGPIPPPPVIPDLDDDLDVNFSDMTQAIDDISDERVYNEDSKEYIDAINKKDTKFGKMLISAKHAMFGDLFRYNKNKKLVKKMSQEKSKEGLDLTQNRSDIAGVHGQQELNPIFELTEGDPTFSNIYNEISDLSHSYYMGGSSFPSGESGDIKFETDLKEIFKNDTTGFKDYLEKEGVSIDKSASDILKSLRMKRAQNNLKVEISDVVETTLDDLKGLSAADPAKKVIENNFVSDMAKKLKKFTTDTQLFPEFLQHFNKTNPTNKVDLSNSYEDIATKLIPHLDVLSDVIAATVHKKVKINMKFLKEGHSTDHIEASKEESNKRWKRPISKLGENIYGKGHRWRRFPTKVLATGLVAGAGVVLMGPIGGILAGSAIAGTLAAGKKAAQLKRKRHSLEKEYIKDSKDTSNFIKETDDTQLEALRTIASYESLKSSFDAILKNAPIDQKKLKGVLSLLLAGFEFQKETGHNAFSMQGDKSDKTEVGREHAYDKVMSDLHRYKELSFKRLNLEGSYIDEKQIKKTTQYKKALEAYNGKGSKFKEFLKDFKKERRKEMLKTGGRTALTHAAIGGATWGISELLGWMGGDAGIEADANADIESPGLEDIGGVTEIDLGGADTLYDLGKFDASQQFSTDISSQMSSLPADTTNIQVDYFAGVDGTPTRLGVFDSATVDSQVQNIQDLLDTGSYSAETIKSVEEEISSINIDKMVTHAQMQGADEGNRYLFASRNLEGIHDMLTQIEGRPELKVDFNFDTTDSVIGNTSYVQADRMTGLDLTAIPEEITPPDDIIQPDPDKGSDWRAGQGVYNEDNTHKGEGGF